MPSASAASCGQVVVSECTRVFTAVARKSPGIPARNGFNGFLRDLPGDRLFCRRRLQRLDRKLDASVEASGPHDFSVRKEGALVRSTTRVHRIQPRVRDDRDTPLEWGVDGCGYESDLRLLKIRIFFQNGLDMTGKSVGGPGRLL